MNIEIIEINEDLTEEDFFINLKNEYEVVLRFTNKK